jgi:hypothetical protein
MVNAVEGNPSGAHGNVLEAIRQQVAPDVQSADGIDPHQLEASNSSLRTIMKKEEIIRKSAMGQDDEDTELLLKILPVTLALDSTSRARAALLSPPWW